MPFILANFQPIGGQARPGIGGAPARWSYKTNDALTAVRANGYFNAVRMLLQIGDIIDVVVVTNLGAANEALSAAGQVIVINKSATAIDTTDATAFTVTNSN